MQKYSIPSNNDDKKMPTKGVLTQTMEAMKQKNRIARTCLPYYCLLAKDNTNDRKKKYNKTRRCLLVE